MVASGAANATLPPNSEFTTSELARIHDVNSWKLDDADDTTRVRVTFHPRKSVKDKWTTVDVCTTAFRLGPGPIVIATTADRHLVVVMGELSTTRVSLPEEHRPRTHVHDARPFDGKRVFSYRRVDPNGIAKKTSDALQHLQIALERDKKTKTKR